MTTILFFLLSLANASVSMTPAASPYSFILQGRQVSGVAPTDGQLLAWNDTSALWEAITSAASLPSQTGNSGKFLTTNGSALSWGASGGATTIVNGANQPYVNNLGLAAAAAAGTLTITLKQANGASTPSTGTSAVNYSVNLVGAANTSLSIINITSAKSIALIGASTLGVVDGATSTIYVYMSGGSQICVSAALFDDGYLVTTTAEVGTSTDATKIYCASGSAGVAVHLVGRVTAVNTSSSWASPTATALLPSLGSGGGGSGFDTVGSFGSSPDAKGASSSGTTITMQPADATHPGMIKLGDQTLGTGIKTADSYLGAGVYIGTSLGSAAANATHGVPVFLGGNFGANGFWFGADFGDATKGGFFGGYTGTYGMFDGLKADFSAVSGIWINPSGGMTKIGQAANKLTLVGNTSCTTLATDGSDIVTCTPSDERLKKNIVPYSRGLDALKGVQPISYQLKSPTDMDTMHTGFSAQNLIGNVSEAVTENSDGFYQIDFWPIIAAQTNAINELRARLEALEGPKLVAKKTIPQRKIPKLPKREKLKFKYPIEK